MKSKFISKAIISLGALLVCATYPVVSGGATTHAPASARQQTVKKLNQVEFSKMDAVPVYVKDKNLTKTHPKTVWYAVGKSVAGDLYEVQSGNQTKKLVVPRKAIATVVNRHYRVALPNTASMKKNTILFMGDSITKGYNGYYNYKNASFPLWVHKYLQAKVHKQGHVRSSVTGHNFNDLFTILPTINFKNPNVLVIEYGTNDYRHSTASLKQVQAKMTQAIKYIRKQNPKIKIYGIIPLPRFDFSDINTRVGIGGYTFPELQRGMAQTYKKLGIPTYNISKAHPYFINKTNFYQKYYDHRVHPTSQTYQQFGYYISQWLQQQLTKK